MSQGKLIVIEGLDGSGKATQAALLFGNLIRLDEPAMMVSFPDYKSESSSLVKMYLAGALGGIADVNVYAASSFYAVDRYASYVTSWRATYEEGGVIVADRYTTSNVSHQMPKLPPEEWDAYLDWLCDYEYVKMGMPAPDTVIYLDMEPETSRKLMEKRRRTKDIHERDMAYLLLCRDAALHAAKKLGWHIIRCCDGKTPLPVEQIEQEILKALGLDLGQTD